MSDFATEEAAGGHAAAIQPTEIEETEKLLSAVSYPGIKAVLQSHLNKLKKAEQEKKRKEELSNSKESSSPVSKAPKVAVGNFVPIEDFAWDQGGYNSPTVTIFIDLEGVGGVKDKVEWDFGKTSLDVRVNGLRGKNYRLVKDNLEKDIIPEQSKCIVKANKIVLKLQKVKGEYSYEHWASLTSKKKRGSADEPTKKGADPMGGLMDMMKDMYEDGDENMKKIIGEAMLKSQRGEKPESPAMPDMPDLGGL